MVYQFNPEMLPDEHFVSGDLKYLVPGNQCRLLDPRRTPLRLLEVKRSSGFFVVEILDFEDKGACWELPLESVDRCQFVRGSKEAGSADVTHYRQIISRLDQPLAIMADPSRRATSEATIAALRQEVRDWLTRKSAFLASGNRVDLRGKTGSPLLRTDLEGYMRDRDLLNMERRFAEQFVRNPHSGELVKGHRIVLAELGITSFKGRQVRDPSLFDGSWSREARADHVLHRIAFVRELFQQLGYASVVLYRGLSCDGPPEVRGDTSFVSATFDVDVAMSHFNDRDEASTGILVRQTVPIERLFMTFLETAQMNQRYKESEGAVVRCGKQALLTHSHRSPRLIPLGERVRVAGARVLPLAPRRPERVLEEHGPPD